MNVVDKGEMRHDVKAKSDKGFVFLKGNYKWIKETSQTESAMCHFVCFSLKLINFVKLTRFLRMLES